MRVIAGVAKGHPLKAPRGRKVRPTSDRVKEALFDLLGDRVEGARVLDLYAGSGSLAIEALSRGAAEACLVDGSQEAVKAIQANLEKTKLAERAEIIKNKAHIALQILSAQKRSFDLIFIDPPYTISLIELRKVFSQLCKGKVIGPYTQIVLESSSRLQPLQFSGFVIKFSRKYGDTLLTFYIPKEGG